MCVFPRLKIVDVTLALISGELNLPWEPCDVQQSEFFIWLGDEIDGDIALTGNVVEER